MFRLILSLVMTSTLQGRMTLIKTANSLLVIVMITTLFTGLVGNITTSKHQHVKII